MSSPAGQTTWSCRVLAWAAFPVVAVAAAGLLSAIIARVLNATPGGPLLWGGVALQTAASGLLYFRRQRPFAVTIGVLAVALVLLAPWPFAGGPLFTFYSSLDQWIPAALIGVGMTSLPCLQGRQKAAAFTTLGLLTVVAVGPWDLSLVVVATGLLHTAVPTLFGLYVTARRRLVLALRERAERAEHEHTLVAERARAEERARMAVEMHDVVTHRLTLMVLQAGALRMTASDEATRRAAEELRSMGCQALEELRDLVGLLRAPPDASAGQLEQAPTTVPASASELANLVTDSRSVGVPVDLTIEGDPALTSPVVTRTANRIVQEALTNVRKHAPGARVSVSLSHRAEGVRLTVSNTVAAGSPDPRLAATGTGSGVSGLRQRVEVVGGKLEAGPSGDGGFQIAASLPAYVPTERTPAAGGTADPMPSIGGTA